MLLASLLYQPARTSADIPASAKNVSSEFQTPPGIEGRVEFWRLIFTKYGEYQRVFHHREHPEIIYSVLDFTEYEAKYKGKKLLRLRQEGVDAETARIQKSLRHLGKGNAPRDAFERRLVELFRSTLGSSKKHFRTAANAKSIRYQRGIKEKFEEGLVRSGRYLGAIEQIFEAEGLPRELGRLPLVESSFNYEAYSSVGAAGIWQFMRSTGRRYMQINSSIDERRDPIIATRAAAKYLKNSYRKTGEWPLAVTSYNHGLQGILNAVNKTGSKNLATIIKKYKGRTFGFASSNFYPSFLAALHVEQNAKLYFPNLKREAPWKFDEVKLGRSLYFKDLMRKSGTSREELERLNLAFRKSILKNRARIPAKSVVKVHYGDGKKLASLVTGSSVMPLHGTPIKVARAESKSLDPSAKSYRVKKGDNLSQIAERFGVSKYDLVDVNNIRNPEKLLVGERIQIPRGAELQVDVPAPVEPSRVEATRRAPRNHKVKKGETLGAIAAKYKVSTRELLELNAIKNARIIRVGQKLKIPGGLDVASGSKGAKPRKKTRKYKVRSGDTLGQIARKFSVSQKELKKLNKIKNVRHLRVGQQLILPSAEKSSGSSSTSTARQSYTVVAGDNLSKIAKKHGTSISVLRKLNPGLKSLLKPGQKLDVK